MLAERRAQGYTIVAVEQAARSQRLGDAVLPDRMLLVLGFSCVRGFFVALVEEPRLSILP
ncbi:hypothetical protein EBU60_03965 [bacterium]|nr:hypothetical protein [bacterium]